MCGGVGVAGAIAGHHSSVTYWQIWGRVICCCYYEAGCIICK